MKIRIIFAVIISAMLISLASCSAPSGKEHSVDEYRTTMQYYEDFKVLQLADLHFGIQTDIASQLDIVKNTIRTEKPDLIILTGDNFMYASKSIVYHLFDNLNNVCAELTKAHPERLTKFAVTSRFLRARMCA